MILAVKLMGKLIIVEAWPSFPLRLLKPLSATQMDLRLPYLLIRMARHPKTAPVLTQLL